MVKLSFLGFRLTVLIKVAFVSLFRSDQLIIIINQMKTSAVMLTLAAAAATSNALDFLTIGEKLATLNTGMMQSMQPDPSNTYSDCYLSSQVTGASITDALDFSNYLTGGFNTADLMSKGQIIMMNLMTQYDDCKYTGFLVQLDQFMSNIPQFAGSFSNLAT